MKESVIRTLVPILLALLAKTGLQEWGVIDSATLEVLVAAAATGLYYVAVRVLERARSSRWGWLLGYPAAPVYVPQHRADA